MGLDLEYINGQTPLDPDERNGLKIKTISNREELNEFEQLNIEKAMQWVYKKNFNLQQILSDEFIRELHKQMFCDVWKWAGTYRQTNKNIGVDKYQIGMKIKNLLDDCNYWISNQIFTDDEICIRFKHKLVLIHPFANGNGRHSRLIADVLAKNYFKKEYFSWGGFGIGENSNIRRVYIDALKTADAGDYIHLNSFARS